MPTCLTIAQKSNHDILINHQLYCKKYGYHHIHVDDSELNNEEIKVTWKYQMLYKHLRALPENDLLVMVNADAAFYLPVALEALMEGRDFLLVDNSAEFAIEIREVQTNFIVVRNNALTRQALFAFILFLHDHLLGDGIFSSRESKGLRNIGCHPYEERVAGFYPNVSTHVNWDKVPCFVINTGPIKLNGHIDRKVQEVFHNKRLNQVIVHRVNQMLEYGKNIHDFDEYPALSNDLFSVYNPKGKVAFVLLYTPNIASSAKVAEHNFKRYCDLHGYALYVYRDRPASIDPSIYGSWLKPWVLRNHIERHDWIFWVDADVLVLNPRQKIEDLLHNCDILLAKDLAGWHFNSGVMGFRHTVKNVELLEELWSRFGNVEDKTYTYSSQGDQFHIIETLREYGLVNENNIIDALSFNTPPALQTADSFIVHYMGQSEPWRTIHMLNDDQKSIQKTKSRYCIATDYSVRNIATPALTAKYFCATA